MEAVLNDPDSRINGFLAADHNVGEIGAPNPDRLRDHFRGHVLVSDDPGSVPKFCGNHTSGCHAGAIPLWAVAGRSGTAFP